MEEIKIGDIVRFQPFVTEDESYSGGQGRVIAKTRKEYKVRINFFDKWWIPKENCEVINLT